MNRPNIQVTAYAYLVAATAVLLLPFQWLVSWVISVSVHELSHLMVLKLWKISVLEISFGGSGAKISTAPLTPLQEIICAAAGPLSSLSLILFADRFPVLALMGVAQSLFNLIPLYPMDGSRILWGVIEILKEKLLAKNES